MNRNQIKSHRIRTYEMNKISLTCFDDKIHILNNEYNGLALGYKNNYKNSYLNNYSIQLFCQAMKTLF